MRAGVLVNARGFVDMRLQNKVTNGSIFHLSLDPSTYHGRNQYEDTATAVPQNAIV